MRPEHVPWQNRTMVVRAATRNDAIGVGMAHVRSWQATYRGHFPQDFLDRMDPAMRAAAWERYLTEGPPERESLLVCDLDGDVVGFVSTGPCRDDDGRSGEVRAIYLLPDHWGRGLGRPLMGAALRELASAGFGDAMLWVFEDNRRAKAFYRATGWTPDGGARVIKPFGFPIPEARYRIDLA